SSSLSGRGAIPIFMMYLRKDEDRSNKANAVFFDACFTSAMHGGQSQIVSCKPGGCQFQFRACGPLAHANAAMQRTGGLLFGASLTVKI
ncbi:MAG: hypothetical protein VX702_01890, partial [Pseudomonadota bacterium]|nr:hypothetical protein [Pseudomonadota bacterium]